jgi:hypothetical protein
MAWIQSDKYQHHLEKLQINLIEINFLVCSNFVKHAAWIMLALTNNTFVVTGLPHRTLQTRTLQ